jgi:Sec-independent protein secretion pathway component TatC
MHRLQKNLRYVILAVAIVAAVVTPTPNAKALAIFIISELALFLVSAYILKQFPFS